MKCPNCGGNMGLEDEVCPFCNTPNTMAVQHQADMDRYREEYQRTQADVMAKTTLLQRHGSWLIILAVLLVLLVGGVILNVFAWDIGYGTRVKNVERGYAEDSQQLDAYLEKGDYGKFVGYYNANDIHLVDDNPYWGMHSTASAYVDLLEYIAQMNSTTEYAFKPNRISDTCENIATDINRIYTIEQQYSYNLEKDLPADKRAYLEELRGRTAAIAKAYFGLTDEQIKDIPNMSTKRLAQLIEEGIAS